MIDDVFHVCSLCLRYMIFTVDRVTISTSIIAFEPVCRHCTNTIWWPEQLKEDLHPLESSRKIKARPFEKYSYNFKCGLNNQAIINISRKQHDFVWGSIERNPCCTLEVQNPKATQQLTCSYTKLRPIDHISFWPGHDKGNIVIPPVL